MANGNTNAKFGSVLPTYLISNHPYLGLNSYFSGGWKYGSGTSGVYAGVVGLDPIAGNFSIQTTSATGTADTLAAMTNRMTITATGNVGVGTASPSDTLDVVGSVVRGGDRYRFALANITTNTWYKLGTWTSTAQGSRAEITFHSAVGYAGGTAENGLTRLILSTGNQITAPNITGYFWSEGGTPILTDIRANTNSSCASNGATCMSWDIYGYLNTFGGPDNFYEVKTGISSTWTQTMTAATPVTTANISQIFANKFNVTGGNVGIGTTAPNTKLQLNAGALSIASGTSTGSDVAIRLSRYTNWAANADGSGGLNFFDLQQDYSNNRLMVEWADSPIVTFASTGNVGIGTTSPRTVLDVVGPLRAQDNGTWPSTGVGMEMIHRAGTGYLQAYNRTGSSWLPMQINGSTVTVTNMSDERVKNNIEDLRSEYGLSGILKLHPVNYNWRDSERDRSQGLQVGLIAQEVQQVFPKLVTQFGTDDTITYTDGSTETVSNVLGLNYNGLIVPLVKSVQDIKAEMDAEIAALKAENQAKDAAIRKLQAESAQIKAFICSQFSDAPMCR